MCCGVSGEPRREGQHPPSDEHQRQHGADHAHDHHSMHPWWGCARRRGETGSEAGEGEPALGQLVVALDISGMREVRKGESWSLRPSMPSSRCPGGNDLRMLSDRLPRLAHCIQHRGIRRDQGGGERVEHRFGVGEFEVPREGVTAAVSGGHRSYVNLAVSRLQRQALRAGYVNLARIDGLAMAYWLQYARSLRPAEGPALQQPS
jgi:hypothetical protein